MATDKEKIVLGSGKTYTSEFDETAGIPDDATLETEENLLGLIQGGATLEYVPTYYKAKDDLGLVNKEIITDEEATLKSGIMTWCGNTLEKLCSTAKVTTTGNRRVVKIGGFGKHNGKKYVIRFVHEDKVDGNIRVTIVGTNQAGFTIAFTKDKETVINAEFKAQPQDKEGTLILYEEDIPETSTEGTEEGTENTEGTETTES